MVFRIAVWVAWQSVVLVLAFIAWANLFSEYGIYTNATVGSVAGVVFLGIALFVGTWLPVRRWRAEQRG